MLGLIEAMIDRLADTLERTGSDIDAMSRVIFRRTNSKVNKKTRDLQSMIEQIGAKAEALSHNAGGPWLVLCAWSRTMSLGTGH